MKKRTYLVRITLYKKPDMDLNELAHKLALAGIPVHHAEIFDEFDFVNKCEDQSVLNEIDLDKLFFDILHITEDEMEHYRNIFRFNPIARFGRRSVNA